MISTPARLLDRVLLTLPDHAVAVCDAAGVITAWNDAAADLTGHSAQDAVGHDLGWLSGSDDPAAAAGLLAAAARGAVRREAWRQRADGSSYWCVSALFAITGGEGETIAYAEGFHDQTAAHHALLAEAQQPIIAAAARSVGTIAVTQDLDLRITWVSGPPTSRTGLSSEDIVGHLEDEFLPADVAAHVAGRKRRVIDTGHPERFDVTLDSDIGRRVFDNSSWPLRAEDGSIIGVVTVGLDVTERRAAEASLRESEARLARAEAIAGIGSWEWDITTGEATWSAGLYALYQLTPEAKRASPHPFYDRVHPQDLERVRGVIDHAAEHGGAFTCDHRLILPGGHVRAIRSRGEVLTDAAGRPVSMAGTAQDITEAPRSPSPRAAGPEAARRRVEPGRDLSHVLTHRQLEVLSLVAEGLRNDEIAERLVLSEATVKWHVRHVLRALGVTTRAQAAIRYLNDVE